MHFKERILKNTDVQPDAEMCRTWCRASRRGIARALSGRATLPGLPFVQLPGNPPRPTLWGFLCKPHHLVMIKYYLHLQSLFSSWIMGLGWRFQFSNCGLLLLVASPHPEASQEPTKDHIIRTKDPPLTWKFQRIWSPLSRNRFKNQLLGPKEILMLLPSRNLQES